MAKTKIEWCDEVWNPVWGCHNNCEYCYARKIAARFGKCFSEKNFIPVWMERNFNRKFAKSTKRVFVNSMSDVKYWEKDWMDRVLLKITEHPRIDFIFLTKGNVDEVYNERKFPPNCILGVTEDNPNLIVNSKITGNISLLNVEPILKPLTDGISISSIWLYDWIIIGALTGREADKYKPKYSWYEPIIEKAIEHDIPYFIKPSLESITPAEYYLQQYVDREVAEKLGEIND